MFDNEKFVDMYISNLDLDGYKLFYKIINDNLKKGSTILEYGSGNGIDYNFLKDDYKVSVSDKSNVFRDKFNLKFGFKPLELDVTNYKLDNKFDAIISNKIFPFVSYNEINKAVELMYKHLNENGFIAHTFWYGEDSDDVAFELEGDDIAFTIYNYNEELLAKYFSDKFDISFQKDSVEIEGTIFTTLIMYGFKK